MARGGKRKGAGRKPTLSYEQRLWVGSEYAARCRQHLSSQLKAKRGIRKYPAIQEVEEYWEELSALSSSERRPEEISDPARRRKAQERLSDLLENIRYAMGPGAVGPNGEAIFPPDSELSFVANRMYGGRAFIEEMVAETASARFALKITPRMVRSCWEEFAAIERRIVDDK